MTATVPANLPALVRRQWDREPDAFHPLVWAEWLEEHGQPDRGELVRLEYECRDPDCDCTRCCRSRDLRETLSVWVCRNGQCECGNGRWSKFDGGYVSEWIPHEPCGGTGNVLDNLHIVWDCGFPRWVTLPTLGDAVGEVEEGCPQCRSMGSRCPVHGTRYGLVSVYHPTPRLQALAATPPWGVPLDGVRVGDREPDRDRGDNRAVWFNRDQVSESAGGPTTIPAAVYAAMDGYDNVPCPPHIGKWYPTEQAAADALARGLVAFAREYTG
jgi:uncharacterized protein (TIGR02996 family)